MKSRAAVVVAGVAAAIVAVGAGPASAWDCIRVSSSESGIMHSTASGNWFYATIDDLAQGAVDEGQITAAQATCAVAAWKDAGEPSYFAAGAGVAGAHGAEQSGRISDADFFELAKNAPVKVMVDGHGVDHLEDALMYYAGECLGG